MNKGNQTCLKGYSKSQKKARKVLTKLTVLYSLIMSEW